MESISCLGKSFTNDAPTVSPADAQASERLYPLAEIIGASKTLPGTLGLCALVVDARRLCWRQQYDQDSLLERAFMTRWKCYEEGVRDIDELVAVAMEAIEGDVADHDMCMDLIQTIHEVFDQTVPEDRKY